MPSNQNDLLNRYLHALKSWLPKTLQKDIAAEIGEDLHSQMQDRESALGRPLDEDEIAAILKQRGSPMRVAAGYLTEPRLINPAMFPIYRMVLRIVLLWVLAPIFFLVFLGPVVNSPHPAGVVALFFVEALRALFTTIGIVTTVFFVFDRYHVKFKSVDDWDPRKLPRVPGPHEPSRWNYFANALFALCGAAIWASLMWHRSNFAFGETRLVLAPVWGQIYWLVLALTLADTLVDLFSFFRPASIETRALCRIVLDAIAIAIVALLFRVDRWMDLSRPDLTPAQSANFVMWANWTLLITLVAVLIVKLVDVILQLRKLIRRRPAGNAPILTVC